MFTIGDFARLGRVSVRMLRHYDAIGLLRPATVDPRSGYRYYRAEQLRRLGQLLALKELGLTLAQVRAVLDDTVDAVGLRGMLMLRRAQLQEQVAADTARLAVITARLRMIDSEGRMTSENVVLKELSPVRVAELTGIARSYAPTDISPVIQPLYPELIRRLEVVQLRPSGPGLAWYEPVEGDDDAILVHAGVTVDADPGPTGDVAVVALPAVPAAATIVHHGSMDEVEPTLLALAAWIEENGWRAAGFARELYLDYSPEAPEKGVTELQIPVVRP
ncbi:MerR family transcriptional regulator [Micromonospora sp. CPCC 205711]|uniref:MerR family transcriptional regulator n=1 Tax=Micromonospora sp. CPCC 205547 TaxID=3122400 RepID=UPI002FF3C89A